jgi:acyl-coenzyme A thioesterase PaaI-like protein
MVDGTRCGQARIPGRDARESEPGYLRMMPTDVGTASSARLAERSLRRLHNDDWGFESSCFVCEPRNAGGLQIPFHHDVDAATVVAEFELSETFSGAPTYVHGGVTLAVLDEAMAWTTIAIGGKFAVTVETAARFGQPVRVGERYLVEARLRAVEGDRLAASAEVRDSDGEVCVTAEASFAVLGAAQAVDAVGVEASSIDPSYLR